MGPVVGQVWQRERSGNLGPPPRDLTEAQLNTIGYVLFADDVEEDHTPLDTAAVRESLAGPSPPRTAGGSAAGRCSSAGRT